MEIKSQKYIANKLIMISTAKYIFIKVDLKKSHKIDLMICRLHQKIKL